MDDADKNKELEIITETPEQKVYDKANQLAKKIGTSGIKYTWENWEDVIIESNLGFIKNTISKFENGEYLGDEISFEIQTWKKVEVVKISSKWVLSVNWEEKSSKEANVKLSEIGWYVSEYVIQKEKISRKDRIKSRYKSNINTIIQHSVADKGLLKGDF